MECEENKTDIELNLNFEGLLDKEEIDDIFD